MRARTSPEWLRILADLSAESQVRPSPEKLRGIADEIKRLRAIELAAQKYRKLVDTEYNNGVRADVINNAKQQALWRALDTPDKGTNND